MKRLGVLVLSFTLLFVCSRAAQARTVEFVSQHPVPHKFGGGFCYIDVPHVHNYPPDDPRMYRESNGQNYFVGDPVPFDYDGPRYSYYGAHPVPEAEAQLGHPVFCYIKGPHYHWYQPPPQAQAQFQFSGGAYWYVGNFPPAYYDDRPRYATVNDAYAPMPYARPVVDVHVAPPGVQAAISFGGPGWSATAVVGGPPVYAAPAPVYVPPPPPGPAVQIGVGINLGGGPGVVERREVIERREYIDERHPPMHGRHEGWREHPRYQEPPRHGGPPSRFAPMPAPVRGPLMGRAAPMHGASPQPTRGPAPMQSGHGAPMPTRGPARMAPAHDEHRQMKHR